MYTIGEISKIVNISANTLRYYDEIGLLKPNLIKDNNQYRYYLDTQIKDIIFIMELKQYGFKLYEIKELMENRDRQRHMFQVKYAKIIMCSGMNNISIILESIKAGAKDFVSKPISSLSIINAVTKSSEENIKINFKSIEYISEILKNTGMDRPLKQDEIYNFIQEVIKGNKDEEFIYNFLNQSNFDCKDNYENFINRQLIGIEEEILKSLKDKCTLISEKIATFITSNFHEDCLINLLTTESITMGEFKTLINNSNSSLSAC